MSRSTTGYDTQINIRMTQQMFDDIKQVSELAGINDATLVRDAVDKYLHTLRRRYVYQNKIRKEFNSRVAEAHGNYDAD